MALMRHAGRVRQCLLLGVQRTRCAHFEFFRTLVAAITSRATRSVTRSKATPKKVSAYAAAKPASEFDPENRDENIDYYVAKLDELVKKFRGLTDVASAPKQESLAL